MTLLERLEAGDLCLEMHPSKNGDHDSGDRARAIVGRYWTKGDLVQMTAVLIAHIRSLEAENVALREILTFDCTAFPAMEAKAIEWANNISGPKGKPPSCPDPVGILELCEDIAKAALNELRARASDRADGR